MEEVRRFRDAYGQKCVAVRDAYSGRWKATFMVDVGGMPLAQTVACGNEAELRMAMRERGFYWTEVDRWQAIIPMA